MDAYVIEQTAESQGREEVQEALEISEQLANGTFLWTDDNVQALKDRPEDDDDELNASTLRMGEDCIQTQLSDLCHLFQTDVPSACLEVNKKGETHEGADLHLDSEAAREEAFSSPYPPRFRRSVAVEELPSVSSKEGEDVVPQSVLSTPVAPSDEEVDENTGADAEGENNSPEPVRKPTKQKPAKAKGKAAPKPTAKATAKAGAKAKAKEKAAVAKRPEDGKHKDKAKARRAKAEPSSPTGTGMRKASPPKAPKAPKAKAPAKKKASPKKRAAGPKAKAQAKKEGVVSEFFLALRYLQLSLGLFES